MELIKKTVRLLLAGMLCLALWLIPALTGVRAQETGFHDTPPPEGYPAPTHEGPGWDTPEEAVLHYLEGFKEQNLYKMIGAYAVETYVELFDLQAQLERITVYSMNMVPRMPNAGSLLRQINIETRKNEIVQSILWQISSACLPDQDFSAIIPFTGKENEETAAEFLGRITAAIESVDFSQLKFICFIPPELIVEVYASERNQKTMQAQSAHLHCLEVRSMIAVFTVSGNVGLLTCDAVRYDAGWFMLRTPGNSGWLLNLSAMSGGVVVMPLDEVLRLFADLDAPQQELIMNLVGGLLF